MKLNIGQNNNNITRNITCYLCGVAGHKSFKCNKAKGYRNNTIMITIITIIINGVIIVDCRHIRIELVVENRKHGKIMLTMLVILQKKMKTIPSYFACQKMTIYVR